jgi:hypothetical protein
VTLNREFKIEEEARSFTLDEIIEHLKDHEDLFDLVFNRQNVFGGLVTQHIVDVMDQWSSANEGQDFLTSERGFFEKTPTGYYFEPESCESPASSSYISARDNEGLGRCSSVEDLPESESETPPVDSSGFKVMRRLIRRELARSSSGISFQSIAEELDELVRTETEDSPEPSGPGISSGYLAAQGGRQEVPSVRHY